MNRSNVIVISWKALSLTTTTFLFFLYGKPIKNYLYWHPWNGNWRYERLRKQFYTENNLIVLSLSFKDLFYRFLTEKSLLKASSESIQILCDIVEKIKLYPFVDIPWITFYHTFVFRLINSSVESNSKLWDLAGLLLNWDPSGKMQHKQIEYKEKKSWLDMYPLPHNEESDINIFKGYYVTVYDIDKEELKRKQWQELYNLSYKDCVYFSLNFKKSNQLFFYYTLLEYIYFYKLFLINEINSSFSSTVVEKLKEYFPKKDKIYSKDDLFFRMRLGAPKQKW